jgi:hypothetical protein
MALEQSMNGDKSRLFTELKYHSDGACYTVTVWIWRSDISAVSSCWPKS